MASNELLPVAAAAAVQMANDEFALRRCDALQSTARYRKLRSASWVVWQCQLSIEGQRERQRGWSGAGGRDGSGQDPKLSWFLGRQMWRHISGDGDGSSSRCWTANDDSAVESQRAQSTWSRSHCCFCCRRWRGDDGGKQRWSLYRAMKSRRARYKLLSVIAPSLFFQNLLNVNHQCYRWR